MKLEKGCSCTTKVIFEGPRKFEILLCNDVIQRKLKQKDSWCDFDVFVILNIRMKFDHLSFVYTKDSIIDINDLRILWFFKIHILTILIFFPYWQHMFGCINEYILKINCVCVHPCEFSYIHIILGDFLHCDDQKKNFIGKNVNSKK